MSPPRSRKRIEVVLDALDDLHWTELQQLATAFISNLENRQQNLPGGTRVAKFRPDEVCSDLLAATLRLYLDMEEPGDEKSNP